MNIHEFKMQIMNEELDKVFKEICVGATSIDSDFEPHRKISFDCNLNVLTNASGLSPDDDFFMELGKRLYNIIHTKSNKA
jgi:hypothetical protein